MLPFRKRRRTAYPTLFVLCLLALLLPCFSNATSVDSVTHNPFVHLKEEYDPEYFKKIQSINDLLMFVAVKAKEAGVEDQTSIEYANILAKVTRGRFYHGYSYHSYKENCIVAVAAKIIRSDFSAIVIPDDIMKYPMAACSQQALVRMACFSRLGIPYRKVTFTGHFASEASLKGKWYYFDTDLEPEFPHNQRNSLDYFIRNKQFYFLYRNVLSYPKFIRELCNVAYGRVNGNVAIKAFLFQTTTKFLFHYFWLFALLTVVLS